MTPRWIVRGKGVESNETERYAMSPSTRTKLEQLSEKVIVKGNEIVNVTVHGNGFWGTMPLAPMIQWDKIPIDPLPSVDVPEHVTRFVELLLSLSHILGNYTDIGHIFDTSPWEETPVQVDWFPYIINSVRKANSTLRSFFYAPSVNKVYLLFVSDDEADSMVVCFDGSSAYEAADPWFDLDDGFLSEVPAEMSAAFTAWVDGTNMDPDAPFLTLLAPFDVMNKKGEKRVSPGDGDDVDADKPKTKKQKTDV
jgi:hypothetical protein